MPDATTKPGDQFIFEDIPRDKPRIAAKSAETRVRLTTKSAIHSYIKTFLDSAGSRHQQIEFTAPFAVSYVTDVSGNPDDDPTIYNVQLARQWKGLREKLPAILIADTGFEWHNSGLGGLDPGLLQDQSNFVMRAAMLASVTLDLVIISLDEQSTSDLADVLAYIFGPLTSINRSHTICSSKAEDNWEVRLPLTGPSPTGLDRRNITDDPIDSVWSCTISIVVEFEGIVQLLFNSDINPAQRQNVHPMLRSDLPGLRTEVGVCPEGANDLTQLFIDYKPPTTIRLGRPHRIDIRRLPVYSAFQSDCPRVAVVDEQGLIRPRKLGKFNLVLVNLNQDAELPSAVLRSTPVEVVAC